MPRTGRLRGRFDLGFRGIGHLGPAARLRDETLILGIRLHVGVELRLDFFDRGSRGDGRRITSVRRLIPLVRGLERVRSLRQQRRIPLRDERKDQQPDEKDV